MSVRARVRVPASLPIGVGLLLGCLAAPASAQGLRAPVFTGPPGAGGAVAMPANPCGFAAGAPAQLAVARPVYPQGAIATMPPPPPPPEMPSPQPHPQMVWQRGHYIWNGSSYAWRPGQWAMAPQMGMRWRDPQWSQNGAQWVFTPGGWMPGGGMPPQPPMYPPQPQPPMYPPQPQPPMYPPQPPQPPTYGGGGMGAMNIGGVFQGTLQPGDTVLPTGALADDYGVFLQAGQTITIDVTGGPSSQGGNLDMYLSVLQNGRELAHDDDSGGNLNPHLVFTAPMPGQYVLRVTTYGSTMRMGSYTVRTAPGGQGVMPTPTPPPQPPYGNPGYPPNYGGPGPGRMGSSRGVPYAIGQMVQGVLQVGDQQLEDGSVGDDYNVFLQAGQQITVVTRGGPSMTTPGSNLDVYTLIYFNNRELTHDDDSAGNFNSRILFTAPQAGLYTIRVSTYGSGLKQGQYQLLSMPGLNPNLR